MGDLHDPTMMVPPPVALRPGAVLGGWRLLERVHEGGMATLWTTERVTGARPDEPSSLLMKIPRLRGLDDPTAIVGFEVEQMLMPRLTGPHVPRFVEAGNEGAQPWLVMERLPGVSLRPRLDDAPLPAAEVADIGARVADALHDLHRQHVIHLDVKPSNIMLTPEGRVVMVDFGLSRHDRLPDLLAEEFRLPLGTGPYIAPEQVLRQRDEPRSDLFALGVLLYHLATGRRPFGAPDSVRGLKRRLWQEPVPPRAIVPQLPPWLQSVILRCLSVDPAGRPATAAQLALLLRHPEQVEPDEAGSRLQRAGLAERLKRRFHAFGAETPDAGAPVREALARAPIVAVAVDLHPGMEDLAAALRDGVRRVMGAEPEARLACLTVLRTHRIAQDAVLDAEGRNRHARLLAQLRHWGRALELSPERLTVHVLEHPDPAEAILDYVRTNHMDQLVMGARGQSALRRHLGSVSTQVVARAPCTVTVVRTGRRSGNLAG